MTYNQLTYEQRCQIYALNKRGFSCRQIGVDIGVHASTISRELRRNRGGRGYRFKQAHLMSHSRRHRKMVKIHGELRQILLEKLRLKWSPEQISGWLMLQNIARISHETIYRFLRDNPRFKRHLRHKGKRYRKLVTGRTGPISNRVDIDQRPDIVEEKTRIGDWELDTIYGSGRAALVSMVDRKSKLCLLRKVNKNNSQSVSKAILHALKPRKNAVITLTSDNGAEFARHVGIARRLEADFFFAKPYASWQRGLNEHSNGLVRQFLPKGTNFDEISENYVNFVQSMLNNRPRKVLGFKTPKEVFEQLTAGDQSVALQC